MFPSFFSFSVPQDKFIKTLEKEALPAGFLEELTPVSSPTHWTCGIRSQ